MVLDASVVFKWIRNGDEQDRDKAIALYKIHLAGKERIIILDFTYLEIANILVTKTKVSQEELGVALGVLFKTNVDTDRVTNSDTQEAAILAKAYKTSVYDMLYAVIAKKHKTDLVTADERFVKVTKFPHVKLLSEYSF